MKAHDEDGKLKWTHQGGVGGRGLRACPRLYALLSGSQSSLRNQ